MSVCLPCILVCTTRVPWCVLPVYPGGYYPCTLVGILPPLYTLVGILPPLYTLVYTTRVGTSLCTPLYYTLCVHLRTALLHGVSTVIPGLLKERGSPP